VRLEDRVEALKERVYYDKLGTVLERVQRIESLSDLLVAYIPSADAEHVHRAAHLAKADLSTGMVGEFPELQGVMGRYYALHDGEDPRVANAIGDHYKPLGPNDSCPTAPEAIVVALAEKIDALVAFFGVGEKPTGSRDPFALRRAALGIIRIILEGKLRINLAKILTGAVLSLHDQLGNRVSTQYVHNDTLNFIVDRLKMHLREQGTRHDLIAAVFAVNEDDLIRLLDRVDALRKFLDSEDGINLLIAYRRAANIVGIEEARDNTKYDDEPSCDLLQQGEERLLAEELIEIRRVTAEAVASGLFEQSMAGLATLRRPVDEFFDKVTVNTDDRALRENRLRLLSSIRAVMNQVADFSQIEG
jgi:glycyl-tRNA synthetase beta chain